MTLATMVGQPNPKEEYSKRCYIFLMILPPETLRQVMSETGTTQSELSRISGVKQPSISQFLSGRTQMSTRMLERLMSCMGYGLEVVYRPIQPGLSRSERRSWTLHRQLSSHLTRDSLEEWMPTLRRNLDKLTQGTRGQPHLRNLERWSCLIEQRELPTIRDIMTGVGTDAVQMREVSPMGGLLPQGERRQVLEAGRR